MVRARVVTVTRVSLSPSGAAPPEPVRLSFLDTVWFALPPIHRLFLYRSDRPFASVVGDLRDSLSRTLPRFYPLAGRLTLDPDSGDVLIRFSGGGHDGVDFLEAEAEGVDFERLADDEDHDVECFSSLVPPLEAGDGELPGTVFSVQATRFAGGGVAVGFSINHMGGDGKALWQFVEAWVSKCRSRAAGGGGGAGGPQPVMDRAVITHPGAEELARRFVRERSPLLNLPSRDTNAAHSSDGNSPLPDQSPLSRRTFVVSAASIASLRDRGTGAAARPSAFVALSAHLWLAYVRAKGIPADDQPTAVGFLVDLRRHLDPPISDSYFGNCVWPCVVRATASELLGCGGFVAACAAIRRAIDESQREPLRGCEDWRALLAGLPAERAARILASPRFRAYEADFGWGRPRRVEMLSASRDGQVVLVGARDEEGAVQASVVLSPLHMDGFTSLFLGGLQET